MGKRLTAEVIEIARQHKMSPLERRRQRRSLIRGLSGNEFPDDEICHILPELSD